MKTLVKMDCPFCTITFLFYADYLQHITLCSVDDAVRKICSNSSNKSNKLEVIDSIKKVLSAVDFIHEYEQSSESEQEHMYVCTDCYTQATGLLLPDMCLACGRENIIRTKEYILNLETDK